MDESTINELMDLEKDFNRQLAIANEIQQQDPTMPQMTAIIIANDRMSAERSQEMLRRGVPYKQASVFVGSYARLEFALWAVDHGYHTRQALYKELPELWSSSDPDDTDKRFLELWHQAWLTKGSYLRYGRPLPRNNRLVVYRGQDKGAPVGIAWSLDPKIAEKFARGAGLRVANRDGIVYRGLVSRTFVYGYLTDRGESEIVVNPLNVMPIEGDTA